MKKLFVVLSFILATASVGMIAHAGEEEELNQEATEINKVPSDAEKESGRTTELSRRFNVPEGTVSDMRNNKKMGWGEISVALAMSQEMSVRSQGTDKPLTTEQSLSEVLRLRTEERMGWGRIAKENGFKLGPVVSATRNCKAAIRTADARSERFQKKETLGRTPRPEKFQKPEKVEKLNREHPTHPRSR